MGQHIAIKLTKGGGPEPVNELRRVHQAAQDQAEGVSWIATRKPGKGFKPALDSRLLAFTQQTKTEVLVLTAKIHCRCPEIPSDPLAQDMYGEEEERFSAYWRICEVELETMAKTDLPGKMPSGKIVSDAFSGSLSFAYWQPGAGRVCRRVASPNKGTKPAFSGVRAGGNPSVPLHGVDFSGGKERAAQNRKLWVASWCPDQEFVSLESGGDEPGFGRCGLAERILQGGGLWVIDFPFGPPAQVGTAACWRTWQDYLAWCGSNRDPTMLRDELRKTLESECVPWSTKRHIDQERRATWFPFFEQLYRQTITGARDVLARLDRENRERTAVLPFHGEHAPTSRRSVVVEGFPGWTLRAQMGLASTGYKHSTESARGRRVGILDALRQGGIPIGDAEYVRAVENSEGDAIDALILLYAAWRTHRRSPWCWAAAKCSGPSIEGWYFD